jgi:hypothetical protein
MDTTEVVHDVREMVGELTDDEAALVRTLTPADEADLPEAARAEHLLDLVELVKTVREDEAMAEYVFAIAPAWDGTIETLLLGGRVTTAFTRFELESCGAVTAPVGRVPVRRGRPQRVLAPVG